ncbi:MAG TPA: pyridoxal-phosphate dependent enzyme [Chondromyces sp.]|nr:pyridoxal-phosphate dependent enzyme [Chondromyces sp.]
MARFHFRCIECGEVYREDPTLMVCPVCSFRQEPGGIIRGVLEVVLKSLPSSWPHFRASDAEFLHAFLPIGDVSFLPQLPVGDTPLLEAPRLRRELGMPRLWLKDDSRNPSGSTKDRASLLVVAKAAEYGCDTIATASTGNAATALAAVAAAVGRRAVVLVPAAAPPAKLVQMQSYGATVVPVDGSYDQAFELCRAACDRFGWYNRSTALNPFTIEGKKTAALEIAVALSLDGPDAVLVPTGDGVILAGLGKGFRDLQAAGLIDHRPRLIAVQPAGSSAIVQALLTGSTDAAPQPGAASIADSLTVEAPRNAIGCLAEIRSSHGGGVSVSDEAIRAAIPRLAGLTGVFAEPAAAAALAGLEAALAEGLVGAEERVVLLITGTGLKDIAAAAEAVPALEPVAPTLEAIEERILNF